MIGIKIIHERANVCIGVGKEPEVAAEGEFLLSVNRLLMCHVSPESSVRRRQKQFTSLQPSDTEAACRNLENAS